MLEVGGAVNVHDVHEHSAEGGDKTGEVSFCCFLVWSQGMCVFVRVCVYECV